jgi:hypothetical protein
MKNELQSTSKKIMHQKRKRTGRTGDGNTLRGDGTTPHLMKRLFLNKKKIYKN